MKYSKQKYRKVRTAVIINGSNGQEHIPEDITDIELAALLCLIVSRKSGSEASACFWAISGVGWAEKLDEGFHDRLNQTARDFAVMGWRGYASSILRVGQTIAGRYQAKWWFERCEETIQNLTALEEAQIYQVSGSVDPKIRTSLKSGPEEVFPQL